MMNLDPPTLFQRAILSALRPDPLVAADIWAETHRILPPDSNEPGRYRNARTPYLVDVQRTMSPGTPWREGWFQGPHQIGKSVTGENLIATWICTAAGSMLVVFPTLDDAKQWELARFEPMRSATLELARRVRRADAKGSDNTKLRKKYPGGVMRLVGANRVGALKSSTIRYIKFEEPDEYVQSLDEQGHPIELAILRTTNFGRKAKIYGDGTPTIDGRSAIQSQVLRGDQRRWHLHCPHCGHPQELRWDRLKWPEGDPDGAAHACSACGALANEYAWKATNYAARPREMDEAAAGAAGLAHWRATAQGEPAVASWYFNALAAPLGWRPWPELARKWLAAQEDPDKLRIFVNTILAECWRDDVRAHVGAEGLRSRAEQYDTMTCPQGGLFAVAGVDTQDNRLAIVIRAFGRREESWGIHHSEIYGDPADPATWEKLRQLLNAPIRHASGQTMHVDAAAIDSGGHHAEDVYSFCRDAKLQGKNWFAVRGAKSLEAPPISKPKTIEFNWRGTPVAGGAQLRWVGTQTIKNLIDGRLKLTHPGGGCYHFPLGFEADYFEQMRSERRELRRDKMGNKALWWVKGRARNEAWDCEVYLYAAFLYAVRGDLAELMFRQRESIFNIAPQADLFLEAPVCPPVHDIAPNEDEEGEGLQVADEADAPANTKATQQPRARPPVRRQGFVNRWRM